MEAPQEETTESVAPATPINNENNDNVASNNASSSLSADAKWQKEKLVLLQAVKKYKTLYSDTLQQLEQLQQRPSAAATPTLTRAVEDSQFRQQELIKDLRGQVAARVGEVQQLQETVQRLQAAKQASDSSEMTLKEQLHEAQENERKTRITVENLETQVQQLNQKLDTLEQERIDSNQQSDKYKTQIDDLNRLLEQSQATLDSQHQQHLHVQQNLSQELHQVRHEFAQYKQRAHALLQNTPTQMPQLEQKLAKLQQEKMELEAQITELIEEKEKMGIKIVDLEHEKLNLTDKYQFETKSRQELQSKLEQLQAQLLLVQRENSQQVNTLLQQHQRQQQELGDSLRLAETNFNQERRTLEQKCNELSKLNEDLLHDLGRTRSMVARWKARYEDVAGEEALSQAESENEEKSWRIHKPLSRRNSAELSRNDAQLPPRMPEEKKLNLSVVLGSTPTEVQTNDAMRLQLVDCERQLTQMTMNFSELEKKYKELKQKSLTPQDQVQSAYLKKVVFQFLTAEQRAPLISVLSAVLGLNEKEIDQLRNASESASTPSKLFGFF